MFSQHDEHVKYQGWHDLNCRISFLCQYTAYAGVYNTIQYFIDNSPWGLFSDNAIKRSNNNNYK